MTRPLLLEPVLINWNGGKQEAFKSLNATNFRRRRRAFSSYFTIIRDCWEAPYENGIPLRPLMF